MIWFLYWVVLIGCAAVALLKWRSKVIADRKTHPVKEPAKIKRKVIAKPTAKPATRAQSKWPNLEPPKTDDEARRRGFDWNAARRELQKLAYGMVGENVSQQDKDAFKALVAEFAKRDPLYLEVMARLKSLLLESPGVLQSDIYKDENESTKELMRYVLYFSEVLGEVQRVKKGRSYQLYLVRDIEV